MRTNQKLKRLGLALCLVLFALLTGRGNGENKAPEEKNVEARHEDNVVQMTKENLEHMDLKTEPATPGNMSMTLKAVGRVSANLNKTAKVTTTLEGRLVKMSVDLNDHVKAGDVVGLVETPELLGRPLELKAPIAGVIVERKATQGELVDKTKEIYTISEPSSVWVLAEVKERDLGAVKKGQDATFTVLAYGGEKFQGKVELIGNEVESATRTLEVRVAAENKEGRLKPGMFADVEIVTTILENVLLLPDGALQTEGENQIVFVALDGNKFEKRVVSLGLEQSGRVQVLDGVKAGEKVVTTGSFILKSELLKGEMRTE